MNKTPQATKMKMMQTRPASVMAAVLLVLGGAPAFGQETPPTPAVDHSQMDHSRMGHGTQPVKEAVPTTAPDHGSIQGGSPSPEVATTPSMARDPRLDPIGDARDPHAYSDGYTFGPDRKHLKMADEHSFGSLMVDRFEHVRVRRGDERNTTYDLQARYGRDYNRFVVKAEGEVAGGEVHESRTELLWSHAVAAFWDLQAGLRYDGGEGPSRRWLAFGVQGLAPYWFEIDATLYLGDEGRSAARVEAEYDLLLSQRLILQPRVELNVYGKEDTANDRGQGLTDVAFGVRLRYEIRREFAPYIGIERVNRYGDTADLYRAAGKPTGGTRLVAGLRFWF